MVMESILKSSEVRRLKRAILVLEGMTYLNDDLITFIIARDEGIDKLKNSFNSFVNDVYCITHAALKAEHACQHDDWLLQVEKWEKILASANILHVDRIIGETE